MHKTLLFILLFGLITFTSCDQKNDIDSEDGLAAFSTDSMRVHVAMLASDSFMGRKPFLFSSKLHFL